jgi:integrase
LAYDNRNVLAIYRRHLTTGFGPDRSLPCPHSEQRIVKKVDRCPVWVEGVDPSGRYHRKSLRTSSWDVGEKLLREMLLPKPPPAAEAPAEAEKVTLERATEMFVANLEGEGRASDTVRKYKLLFKALHEFAEPRGVAHVADLDYEQLIAFRKGWTQQGPNTRNKQLDRLKAFFASCHEAGFIVKNPAKRIKIGVAETVMPDPFTPKEQAHILAKPCVARIRCLVHVLFHSALRISDACMLKPDDFDGTRIRRVNRKNRRTVLIPVPPSLKAELDRLPLNGGHYFLIGESLNVPTQTDAWRTILNEMFKKEVPGFHAHRFRHTAAVNWLTANPPLTIEEVAGLLGNSVKVVEKHYATWCGARQQAVEDKLARTWAARAKLVRVK